MLPSYCTSEVKKNSFKIVSVSVHLSGWNHTNPEGHLRAANRLEVAVLQTPQRVSTLQQIIYKKIQVISNNF
jgi:hypothetical protein